MQQQSICIIRSIIFQGLDNGLDEKHCLLFLIFEHSNSHEYNNLIIRFIEFLVRGHLSPWSLTGGSLIQEN